MLCSMSYSIHHSGINIRGKKKNRSLNLCLLKLAFHVLLVYLALVSLAVKNDQDGIEHFGGKDKNNMAA